MKLRRGQATLPDLRGYLSHWCIPTSFLKKVITLKFKDDLQSLSGQEGGLAPAHDVWLLTKGTEPK